MKTVILCMILGLLSCQRGSEKSQHSENQSPVLERSVFSATIHAKVEIRQGEIEFLENAFNEDRGVQGSCYIEVFSGEVQKFKLWENNLEITSNHVTVNYARKSGRPFSIFGRWESIQQQSKLSLTSSLLIKEDKSMELTNTCSLVVF